jgi:hypothetical protein
LNNTVNSISLATTVYNHRPFMLYIQEKSDSILDGEAMYPDRIFMDF